MPCMAARMKVIDKARDKTRAAVGAARSYALRQRHGLADVGLVSRARHHARPRDGLCLSRGDACGRQGRGIALRLLPEFYAKANVERRR